jgi:predicted ATPase/class 3 adenylate cyclase/Tfp pilus assembly protein PilF
MDNFTFFFTDIEDSTAKWERDAEAMQSAVARHDAIVSDVIERCGGRVYKTVGDGVCAAFRQSAHALAAAVSLQHALATESWATAEPLRVRIAIASGEARLRAGEYFGPVINLVARLLSLCHGGHTLLSKQAASAAGDGSLAGAQIRHHGWYRLKGIAEPVEVAELTADSAACTPPPDSEKAYRVVRIGDRWRPLRDIPNNLAAERDQFIGRETALRELAKRLARKTRLVTVLGTGGIGKTRLVRHYAAEWLGEWPGGVYFCDLSEARGLEGIHFTVSMALGVPLGRDDAGEQLGRAIAGRGACLVILDNFEQVQTHSAATVGRWLDQAGEACFIVTSRERLQLAGESVFALDPMEVSGDAMALFETRARQQQSGFAVDDGNRMVVAEIVRLLDGLPLAIELAAARVRVLSPLQIVERMKDRFVLLAGARGVAARQETLRAAIDWSWALLATWEQFALAQCSVFDGGFSLAAVEAVVHLPAGAPPVIDVIQGLLDKSLLRAWLPGSSRLDAAEPYFGMYISIHEYAGEKLRELGESYSTEAERRHGHYFTGFGSDVAIDALTTHGGIARRHRLAMDLDNLVAACRRAISRADPDTAAACFLAAFAVLEAQGPFTVAETVGRCVADLAGLVPAQRARVLTAVAHAMFVSGRPESADAALRDALAAARTAQDRRAEANSLRQLAVARHLTGHRDEAHECFSAALALCEAKDRPLRAALLANLANLQMEQGRMAEAQASYHAALDLHREIGNRAAEGIALGNLGTLHHDLGQLDEARAAYEAALAIHRDAGSVLQQAITLGNLGLLVSQQGNHDEAVAHYRTALSIHREIGNRRGVGVILKQMGQLEHALGYLARAEAGYNEALAIFREIENRRFEGGVLDDISEIMIDQCRLQTALELTERSEQILRDIDDPLSLAEVLCTKGRALAGLGDAAAAGALLVEAEAIATRLGAKQDSSLQRKVGRLREALHEA